LQTIAEALTTERFLPEAESDPKKALSKIKNEKYDLIVTDLMMPEVTGIELVNAAKEYQGDTKVIVITGFATVDTAIEAVKLGVYDYINKPIDHWELLKVVNQATDTLELTRKNESLNRKNKKILNHLSLLIDISKILYHVHDLNSAYEMVLDTLSEYFKYKQVAIFKENAQLQNFNMVAQLNFDSFPDDISFALPAKINGKELLTESETEVVINGSGFSINTTTIEVANGIYTFIPIAFRDKTIGFILVYQQRQSDSSHEKLTMAKILASQVAPVLHALDSDVKNDPVLENGIVYMIHDHLNHAKSMLSPITFALIRFDVNALDSDTLIIRDVMKTCHTKISEKIMENMSLIWQTQDTALLIMPEIDSFNAESFCKKLKNETESYIQSENNSLHVDVNFACLAYPEAGDTAQEITDHLWVKLFQEIEFSKNDTVEIVD
jgi:CheY-like chemotaxis protein